MSLIFNWDGRSGSLRDKVSNTLGTLTAGTGGFKKTEKGMAMLFDGADTLLDTNITPTAQPLTGDVTVEAWVKPYSLGETAGRVVDNGKLILYVSSTNNAFRFISDSGSVGGADDSLVFNKYQHILVTRTNAGIVNIYLNNFLSGTANQDAGTPAAGTSNIIIGNQDGSTRTFDGQIAKVAIHDKILTQAERNELYKDFLNSYGTTEQKRNFVYPKSSDLSSEVGLVAAYNMIPSNGTLVDISGNGNDGTISGALSSRDGMAFDGVDDNVQFGVSLDCTKSFTIAQRIKPSIFTSWQLLFGAMYNDGAWFSLEGAKLNYRFEGVAVNYNSSQSLTVGKEVDVILTYDLDTTTSRMYMGGVLDSERTSVAAPSTGYSAHTSLGKSGSLYAYTGEIKDTKLYNYAFTPAQAAAYHNSFNKPVLRETFSDSPVGATHTRGWTEGTTTGVIQETVDKKYLEFQGAGTMIIPVCLDSYVGSGYITYEYYNGSAWATRSGLVNAPVTGVAYSGGFLTFTGVQASDGIANILVKNAERI